MCCRYAVDMLSVCSRPVGQIHRTSVDLSWWNAIVKPIPPKHPHRKHNPFWVPVCSNRNWWKPFFSYCRSTWRKCFWWIWTVGVDPSKERCTRVQSTVVGHNPAPLHGASPAFTLIGLGFRPWPFPFEFWLVLAPCPTPPHLNFDHWWCLTTMTATAIRRTNTIKTKKTMTMTATTIRKTYTINTKKTTTTAKSDRWRKWVRKFGEHAISGISAICEHTSRAHTPINMSANDYKTKFPPHPQFQCCCNFCCPTCELISAEMPTRRMAKRRRQHWNLGARGTTTTTPQCISEMNGCSASCHLHVTTCEVVSVTSSHVTHIFFSTGWPQPYLHLALPLAKF